MSSIWAKRHGLCAHEVIEVPFSEVARVGSEGLHSSRRRDRAMSGKKEAQEMSDRVRKDLADFGLITSKDKFFWKVTQEME